MLRKPPCLGTRGLLAEAEDEFDGDHDVEEEARALVEEEEDVDYSELVRNDEYLARDLKALAAAAQSSPDLTTNGERMLALAMARHPRLGADSAAQCLNKDLLRLIFMLLNQEVLCVVGGELSAHTFPCSSTEPVTIFDDVWELDLSVFNGPWRELPPLPKPLTDAAVAIWRDCIVVVGGISKWTSRDEFEPNLDLLVFSRLRQQWETFPLDGRPRIGCSCVVYGDTLVVSGGSSRGNFWPRAKKATQDIRIDLVTKSWRIQGFPRRFEWQNSFRTRSFLVGEHFLMVMHFVNQCRNRARGHDRYEWIPVRNVSNCCMSLQFLDLRAPEASWTSLPLFENLHFCDSVPMWLQDGVLRIAGGQKWEIQCPCCGPMETRSSVALALDLKQLPRNVQWKVTKMEGVSNESSYCVGEMMLPVDGGARVRAGGQVVRPHDCSDDGMTFMANAEVLLDTEGGSLPLSSFGVDEADDSRPVARTKAGLCITVLL